MAQYSIYLSKKRQASIALHKIRRTRITLTADLDDNRDPKTIEDIEKRLVETMRVMLKPGDNQDIVVVASRT